MSRSTGNRNNGEDPFREWLSDHLRYLVLLIGLLLAAVVIIMTVSLLDNRPGGADAAAAGDPDAVVIMSEAVPAIEVNAMSEAGTDSVRQEEASEKLQNKEPELTAQGGAAVQKATEGSESDQETESAAKTESKEIGRAHV